MFTEATFPHSLVEQLFECTANENQSEWLDYSVTVMDDTDETLAINAIALIIICIFAGHLTGK